MNDSFSSRPGPYQHQRTVQIQVDSGQVLQAIRDYQMNLFKTKKLKNAQQPIFIHEDPDKSPIETKSTVLLQTDHMKTYSLQSNIDDISSNSSISIRFLSQKTLSTNTSRTLCSTASLLSQDAIESNENKLKPLRKYKTEGTQTKLFAILLPNSPLSVMKQAKIETRTLMNVTRTCQINTLSYLIKTNESQIEIQRSLENVSNKKQIVRPSPTSFFSNETPFIEKLLSKEKVFDNKSSMESKHQMLIGYRNQKQIVDVPNDEFKEKQLK
ncbi:unnamed protein product, partial [Rotaria magnacalcarata]